MAASEVTVMIDEGGPVMTRARLLSKSKALTSSRNVVKSHLGSAVIRNSTTENVVHQLNIRRLQLENDWRLRQLDNDVKIFRSRRERLPEPLLVVDRPPTSPLYYETSSNSRSGGENGQQRQHQLPGYMRPTTRTAQALPVIPTIDAFRRLNTKNMLGTKTTSVSRTAYGRSNIRFRSAVLPSWPLTDAEQLELRGHWQQHCEQLAYSRRRQRSLRSDTTDQIQRYLQPDSDHQQGSENTKLQRRLTIEQQPVTERRHATTTRLLSTGNVVEHDVIGCVNGQRPLLARRNTTGADCVSQLVGDASSRYQEQATVVNLSEGDVEGVASDTV